MGRHEDEFDRFIRRVKDLERKVWDYVEEEIRRVASEVRGEFESFERMLSPSWSQEGFLKPLYSVRDEGSVYAIYIDLPRADEGTIDIRFKDNKVLIKAKLRETTSFRPWSGRGGEIRFTEYRELIEVPVKKIDPSRVRIVKKKQFVKIIIPKD